MGWIGISGVLKLMDGVTMGRPFALLKFNIPFRLVSF